jgi:hypothetical protein
VVDRCVGLDRVIDRERVRRLDLPLDGAHEAARQRAREAERVADRVDLVADDDGIGVPERQRRQCARVRVDLEDRGSRTDPADDGRVDLVLS